MNRPEDDHDPFWTVQLSEQRPSASPFASDTPKPDYEDRALPAGTILTEETFAGVLGGIQSVDIPITTNVSSGGSKRSGGVDRRRRRRTLRLQLRQVNGDGVMSGVGGDVWGAAVLLSSWLLANPTVVRDKEVLELGSGLGLCGIVAGYLARSVILTDYVDELLLNMHHNVERNHMPLVVEVGGNDDQNASPDQAGKPEQSTHVRELTRREGGARGCASATSTLRAVRRTTVRRIDWTAYAGQGRGLDVEEETEGCGEYWWDDRGPSGAERRRGGAPAVDSPEVLSCDVVIGSALIYSPHHACVADVLARAFKDGGCTVAYVVQLSTRLSSCGLRYDLRKMTASLPSEVLSSLREHPSTLSREQTMRGAAAGAEEDPDPGRPFEDYVLCTIVASES